MTILLVIQQLDYERLRLNEQLRAYPLQWEELKKKREHREAELQQAQKANDDFNSSRSRLEQERFLYRRPRLYDRSEFS